MQRSKNSITDRRGDFDFQESNSFVYKFDFQESN